MAILIGSEALIPLRQAARLLPKRRAGKPAHVATLYRWAQRGLRGVRLETIQVGGTLCTTREALQRFFDRLSKDPEPETARERSSAARERAAQRVDEELERLGI